MGTPDFSALALGAIVDAGHEVVAVYSQPARRAGRGKHLMPTAVQKAAEELGLPVHTPLNFKDESDLLIFENHGADIAVVAAYGLLLPQRVLDAPKHGCLNIHASLLPRWRGAAPIQRAIMAGDDTTGICIMQMEAGLDTGPVLLRGSIPIPDTATAGSVHDQLADLGAELIVKVLENPKQFRPEPQNETNKTYARKIDKSEARIDWMMPAEKLSQHIRGLSPFPGAWCMVNDVRVKVLNCTASNGSGAAGEALDDNLLIACGDGALRLTRVQKAGKAPSDAADFLRGFPVEKGTVQV